MTTDPITMTVKHVALDSLLFKTHCRNRLTETGLAVDRADGTELYYKRLKSADQLWSEVEATRYACLATCGVAGVAVPRVYGVVADEHLLLMQPIASRTNLFNYLWNRCSLWPRRSRGGPTFEAVGRLLGDWFSAYHAGPVQWELAAERLRRVAAAGLVRLQPIDRLMPGYLPDAVCDAIRRRLVIGRALEDEAQRRGVVRVHGDPNLSNILITSNYDLALIDFGDSRLGFGLEDVVSVWQTIWAISSLSRRHHRRLRPCLDALLEQYGDLRPEDDLFRFLRTTTAVAQVMMGLKYSRGRGPYRRLADVNRDWLATEVTNG